MFISQALEGCSLLVVLNQYGYYDHFSIAQYASLLKQFVLDACPFKVFFQ